MLLSGKELHLVQLPSPIFGTAPTRVSCSKPILYLIITYPGLSMTLQKVIAVETQVHTMFKMLRPTNLAIGLGF